MPPPQGGTAASGLPAPPAGIDPFLQYELSHLAKISSLMETVVERLALTAVATFFTALLTFLRRSVPSVDFTCSKLKGECPFGRLAWSSKNSVVRCARPFGKSPARAMWASP